MTPSEQKLMDVIKALEQRLKVLEDWKAMKTRQQISLPLDESSKNIINNI